MNTREILDVLKPLLEEVEVNQKMLAELRSKNEQVIETVRLLNQKLLEMEVTKQQNTGALKDTVWADNPQAAEIDLLRLKTNYATAEQRALGDRVWTAQNHDKFRNVLRIVEKLLKDNHRLEGNHSFSYTDNGTFIYDLHSAIYALMARDLIEQHPEWTLEAYNHFIEPVTTVWGPVHPDDVLTRKDA